MRACCARCAGGTLRTLRACRACGAHRADGANWSYRALRAGRALNDGLRKELSAAAASALKTVKRRERKVAVLVAIAAV